MSSRTPSRILLLAAAFWHAGKTWGRRRAPANPKRILIAHHLLLGDTLMLTPLLAKLRERYPAAELVMTTPKAIVPLYQKRPYGVMALSYDPKDLRSLAALLKFSGFDLAIVPGDNRLSWLALAMGAKWIVAFAGDRPAYKSWPTDKFFTYPPGPAAWGDMVAELIPGDPPTPYNAAAWPPPNCAPVDIPKQPYCVLHVGARSSLKLWENSKWRKVAEYLSARGFIVVWSGSQGESSIVSAIDPEGKYRSYVGQLDLAQLWYLLKETSLLISPDTGVAHLGRITDAPTITLFGPGSNILSGAGKFWRYSPYRTITLTHFPCRNQTEVFKRNFEWIELCRRDARHCQHNACMQGIEVDVVIKTAAELLSIEEKTPVLVRVK